MEKRKIVIYLRKQNQYIKQNIMKKIIFILLFVVGFASAQTHTLTSNVTIPTHTDLYYDVLDLNGHTMTLKNHTTLTVNTIVGEGTIRTQANGGNGHSKPLVTINNGYGCMVQFGDDNGSHQAFNFWSVIPDSCDDSLTDGSTLGTNDYTLESGIVITSNSDVKSSVLMKNLTVFDMNGRKVLESHLNSLKTTLNGLKTKGIYIVVIETEKGVFRKKFVW